MNSQEKAATPVSCGTCGGKPCERCGGSGVQVEQHEPWAGEVVGCGWCNGEPCPDCGQDNTDSPVSP